MLKAVLLLTLLVSCYGMELLIDVIQKTVDDDKGVIDSSTGTTTYLITYPFMLRVNAMYERTYGASSYTSVSETDWQIRQSAVATIYNTEYPYFWDEVDLSSQEDIAVVLNVEPATLYKLIVKDKKVKKDLKRVNLFILRDEVKVMEFGADWKVDVITKNKKATTLMYGYATCPNFNAVRGNCDQLEYVQLQSGTTSNGDKYAELFLPLNDFGIESLLLNKSISFSMPVEEVEEDGPSGLAVAAFAIACSAAGVVVAHILVHAFWRPAHTYARVEKR